MPRFVIQSMTSGKFLVLGEDGEPCWIRSLREAGAGVFTDKAQAVQLIHDNCDFEFDQPSVVDLDKLGTKTDYVIT